MNILRKGWCPGVLRPMHTGDGLLVRLRLTGGILPMKIACEIADLAKTCGNGLIEISSRANLQLRGVRAQRLAVLQQALAALGLLDADEGAEAVRNVLANPLAGLDPAIFDIRPVTLALEQHLARTAALHALPGKFLFVIDDGSAPNMHACAADVRFELVGTRFRLSLGGADHVTLGDCTAECLPDMAEKVARLFLECAGSGQLRPRRMRDLVAGMGIAALASRLGADPAPRNSPAATPDPSALLGLHRLGLHEFIGVAAPFGRFDAHALAQLARGGGSQLRLTPWRMLLAIGPTQADALAQCHASGWIIDRGDPRLAVAACSGWQACAHATTQVQADAAGLAALLPLHQHGIHLHVSGCAKGCANAGPVPITLVGNGGRYDLVLNGSARDEPAHRGLNLAQAAEILKEHWRA